MEQPKNQIVSRTKVNGAAHQAPTGDRLRAQQPEEFEGEPRKVESKLLIAIAATFAADLLLHPLKFWMETLTISADVTMAPYAQVMQELLSPESLLSKNETGFNILLIRWDDWIRERLVGESVEQNLEHIRRVASEFVLAIGVIRNRTNASILLFFCPPSSALPGQYTELFEELQSQLKTQMGALARVHCWSHADVVRLYPVVMHEDLQTDRIGHIPYTNEYFVAIATLLARRIATLLKPQYKVIVIDCDNTLWRGVCGEDGPAGVEPTPAHLQFQKLLIRQHDAGMLLCLCSKNNASDVESVFKSRPDMLLREAHLVSFRVNWQSKSSNLQSLSQELGLSLDSFIFVDDDPVECAEVQVHCPSVLTLQFPQTPEAIAHFLDHVWAFDHIGVTEDARRRTAQYKENRVRRVALEQAADLKQFLASLELKVDISFMQAGQLGRVAELVQRTNQFNLTTIRRRSSDIEALWSSGELNILVVHVRDRFGDYGLVGALFVRCEPSSFDVDTFVLSCRVLGRGVEHQIMSDLGEMARKDGLKEIVLRYRQTPRNGPAWEFLERSFMQFGAPSNEDAEAGTETVFRIPLDHSAREMPDGSQGKRADERVKPSSALSPGQTEPSAKWHEAAYRLSALADLLEAIDQSTSPRQQPAVNAYVAPRSRMEATVAGIFAEVIGLKEVGIHDDFFELGGDSLKAVQAISRISSVLGLEFTLAQFFEAPTPEKVAATLVGASQASSPIRRIDRTRPIPLSSAQRRLWFIDQLEDTSAAYHVCQGVRLTGPLDQEALRSALDSLVNRHEALRTVFIDVNGEPGQEIVPEKSFELRFVDLRRQKTPTRDAEVRRRTREGSTRPFDLSVGPLIRGELLQLSEEEHVLLIVMHHIVSDGWSIGVLVREMGALYAAHRAGEPDALPQLPIQYADYAHWQRQLSEGPEMEAQLEYWKGHLQGAPELLDLPTDRPRPARQSYRGSSASVSLGSKLAADLKSLSRRLNLTLAMTLHTAWSIVLSRLSGQDDIVVGMPVANRRRIELEGLIGFFVNTLTVRLHLQNDSRVIDLLQQAKGSMLGAYAHQDLPFEQIVEALRPVRSLSHNPLFQAMFVLQNAPRGAMELAGLTLVEEEIPLEATQFDLLLSLREMENDIAGTLNYATDLFDSATIERWIVYLKSVLEWIARDPQQKVSELQLMSEDERRQVIDSFNQTHVVYPRDKLIHELFEEQAERAPNAIAVVHEHQSLTYAELNAKANQLARYLLNQGVGPDQLVGVCVGRSLEMVVGLLGILKAGGAYVPLDPHYPAERLQYMLEDSAPLVVLTQEELRGLLPATQAEVIALDAKLKEIGGRIADNIPAAEVGLAVQNLVYVIYTSGSTGSPKGTAMSHRSMVNLIEWHRNTFGACEGRRVLQFAALSFDVAFQETFSTLCTGGTVVLVDEWIRRDVPALAEFLIRHSIHRLFVPPLMLQSLAEHFTKTNASRPASLQDIITAGEQLRITPEISGFFKQLNRCGLHNHYGPTETHVVTSLALTNTPDEWPALPTIGRPISNSQIYILDERQQPVPIGVSGEIYVGGAGVARGYLRRPDLTALRFLPDPFQSDLQARMYRTGDLGRWRSDGRIEYLGRNDNQVKIRGYRIELGEVETQLARHAQVKETVVVSREDAPGQRRLVAYIVPKDPSKMEMTLSVDALRAHLKGTLPEFMIPSAFVMLEHLPSTPNGKLDRHALPVPEYVRRQYEAPRGAVEEFLAEIWTELLRVDGIGRRDDFFDLGGHSLLATRVISRVRERLQVELPVRVLFDAPTVEEMAVRVEAEGGAQAAQEALWSSHRAQDLRRDVDELRDDEVVARIMALERELGHATSGESA